MARVGPDITGLGLAVLLLLVSPTHALAQRGPDPVESPSIPWITDTEMGREDRLALLLMLGDPRADVRAVSVVGDGIGRCPDAAGTALRIIALAVGANDEIPVACGAMFPLDGFHSLPPAWHVPVDQHLSRALFAGLDTPAAIWAAEVNQSTLAAGGFYYWDALAANVALEPSSCDGATFPLSVGIATDKEGWSSPETAAEFPAVNWRGAARRHLVTATAGVVRVDPDHGVDVFVCSSPDVDAFVASFRQSLSGR